MNGGYIMIDCMGLDLSDNSPQSITGIWAEAKKAMAANKPMVAYGSVYGSAEVSPVPAFGWYLAANEIVIVGATLHVHVKNDDTATVLDVVGS